MVRANQKLVVVPCGVVLEALATSVAVPPTAERISSFLSYIRRRIADDTTATAASAAGTLATPSSPDVSVDANEGATASPAFAASASAVSSDVNVSTRTDVTTLPTDVAADIPDDVTVGDPGVAIGDGASAGAHGSATKKRRRKISQTATASRHVRRHCQRMAQFGTSRGNTPGSGPGPVEGHPMEDLG